MSDSINIHELSKQKLKDAVLIVGFPSIGLVGTIVANFLINNLKLEQIGIIDSTRFPAISVVKDGEPHNPMRLYAGEQVCNDGTCNQVVVCVSEFTPPTEITKDLVNSLVDWGAKNGCTKIISAEGFNSGPKEEGEANEIYGITSTMGSRVWIEEAKVKPFTYGTVGGITGALLNQGKMKKMNVLGLLAEVNDDSPDARAAAEVIKAIDELLLAIEMDIEPLLKEAEALEKEVQVVRDQAPSEVSSSVPRYIG